MKKAIPIFIVLVAILSILLYLRLREQRLEAERPSGGSATIEGTQVDVIARLPARVATIRVREGGAVKKGDVIAELDCREQEAMLAQAEASLRAAKSALRAAQLSSRAGERSVESAGDQVWMAHAGYKAARAQKEALEVQRSMAERTKERLEKVHVVGAVSEQKLDQSESQAAGLKERLEALKAQAQAAQARTSAAVAGKKIARIKASIATAQASGAAEKVKAAEAAVERARVGVGECTLQAPISGYVLERNFEPGEVVLPGSRLVTIVDISEVTATFYLPNAELSAAKPGRSVEVKADAYPKKVFEGRISHVAAEAEFTPRNVQTREDRTRLVYAVEVTIPNPDELLRPGMPVVVTIPGTGEHR